MNRGARRRLMVSGRVVLLIVAGSFCASPFDAAPKAPTEYEVKAAFIYNFAWYVQWPESSAPDTKTTFVVGVIGVDPFGRVLDDVMRGQSVQSRPVVVRRIRTVEDILQCDILFVASSETKKLPTILSVLGTAAVLTVGDMDDFAERGGMINLTTEGNRIRFEVNVDAVTRARLKAGSKLLRLARIVREAPSGTDR